MLEITEKLVTENKLTTLMITHNTHDAIAYGNRLIMMHEGRIVVDVSGEEKKKLTIRQLLGLFEQASGIKCLSNTRSMYKAIDKLMLCTRASSSIIPASGTS